jgi:hypothetical protein
MSTQRRAEKGRPDPQRSLVGRLDARGKAAFAALWREVAQRLWELHVGVSGAPAPIPVRVRARRMPRRRTDFD